MNRRSNWMLRRRFRYPIVLLVQCAIVLACVAVTSYAATRIQERQIRTATEERVLDVAQSLAALEQVQESIGTPDGAAELQPLAELIRESSGVDYVVITDEAGIRLTHPNPQERGQLVSTDPTPVLAGQTFIGTERGTLGPTLRAKVPVYRDGAVIGTASVGILESEIAADHQSSIMALVPWVLAALLVGCLGAAGVSFLVGRRVRRLESEVVELDVQRRLARALREQTHEFRTHVHAIYGLIESGESDAALDYISDLAPVSGSSGIAPDVADARLRAVLAAFAADLTESGGELMLDPLCSVPAGVIGDDDIGVIANLLRNAIEATTSAGRAGMVRAFIHVDVSTVEVVVSDDGPGIDDEALPHLFQHGFSTKSDGDGPRGVGLALVMRAVQSRDGSVEVGSSDLGGARFAVTLPVPQRAGAQAQAR